MERELVSPAPTRRPLDDVRRPSLCMINYNGERYLERSLAAVEPLRGSLDEVLLVDDASTDGSVALVERCYPWVRVLRQPRNGGPAAARNAGLRAARGDSVLLVDNDVCVPPGAADRLRDVLAGNPAAAVAMARIVFASRPDLIHFGSPDSHFIGLQIPGTGQLVSQAPRDPSAAGSLNTSCFLVDRARLSRAVEFDEDFFIYLEDHDFGLRVRGLGHDLIAVPDVVCLHGDGTESISIRTTGAYSKTRVFCLIRNRWLLISKNYRLRTLLLLAPALALFEGAQLAVAARKGWLGEWLAAAGWMIANAGAVARKRKAVLAARVLSDRDLLAGGPIPFRPELASGRVERWGQSLLDRLASANWSLVRRWI